MANARRLKHARGDSCDQGNPCEAEHQSYDPLEVSTVKRPKLNPSNEVNEFPSGLIVVPKLPRVKAQAQARSDSYPHGTPHEDHRSYSTFEVGTFKRRKLNPFNEAKEPPSSLIVVMELPSVKAQAQTFAESLDELVDELQAFKFQSVGLMDLPGELRNQIWRLALIKEEDSDIIVDRMNYIEPGLLRTSSLIRHETKPLYREENEFKLVIKDLESGPQLEHWVWRVPEVLIGYENQGLLSWTDLKEWLKLFWERTIVGVPWPLIEHEATPRDQMKALLYKTCLAAWLGRARISQLGYSKVLASAVENLALIATFRFVHRRALEKKWDWESIEVMLDDWKDELTGFAFWA